MFNFKFFIMMIDTILHTILFDNEYFSHIINTYSNYFSRQKANNERTFSETTIFKKCWFNPK